MHKRLQLTAGKCWWYCAVKMAWIRHSKWSGHNCFCEACQVQWYWVICTCQVNFGERMTYLCRANEKFYRCGKRYLWRAVTALRHLKSPTSRKSTAPVLLAMCKGEAHGLMDVQLSPRLEHIFKLNILDRGDNCSWLLIKILQATNMFQTALPKEENSKHISFTFIVYCTLILRIICESQNFVTP